MNNKYKPMFYARTQPKLAYVKKTDELTRAEFSKQDTPAPEFNMRKLEIENLCIQLLKKLIISHISQRHETNPATKLYITPKNDYLDLTINDQKGETA